MKEALLNILIFIMFFNLIVIVFPEGKTQKYCKLVIKLFLFIYIFNIVLLKGSISLDNLLDIDLPAYNSTKYKREVNFLETHENFIRSINRDIFDDKEVIKNIIVKFTNDMKLDMKVYIYDYLTYEERELLLKSVSKIFNTDVENIEITF